MVIDGMIYGYPYPTLGCDKQIRVIKKKIPSNFNDTYPSGGFSDLKIKSIGFGDVVLHLININKINLIEKLNTLWINKHKCIIYQTPECILFIKKNLK